METYLSCAAVVMGVVWLYLVYSWFKSQREFQKETGINSFLPLQTFSFLLSSSKSETEILAYRRLKQKSRKQFRIWALTLLLIVVGAFIVGISTAGNK